MNNQKKLRVQLNELEGYYEYRNHVSESISKATVGWQTFHILKVINIICEAIKVSNPKDYKKRFNKYKTVCFIFNFFPRGKGRAPKVSRPPEVFNLEDIINQFKLTNSNIQDVSSLDAHVNFEHPIFGQLNKKETQKFFVIHTEHHLKIIREILKAQ